MIKILLIEDEQDASRDIANFLRRNGYVVVIAYTGKEALTALREDSFDLAVVDLILPDLTGQELCAFIRRNKRTRNLPIIVSTGIDNKPTEELCKKLGANVFLAKPYSVEELLEAVKRVVSG